MKLLNPHGLTTAPPAIFPATPCTAAGPLHHNDGLHFLPLYNNNRLTVPRFPKEVDKQGPSKPGFYRLRAVDNRGDSFHRPFAETIESVRHHIVTRYSCTVLPVNNGHRPVFKSNFVSNDRQPLSVCHYLFFTGIEVDICRVFLVHVFSFGKYAALW